jgi:hypothetical protein
MLSSRIDRPGRTGLPGSGGSATTGGVAPLDRDPLRHELTQPILLDLAAGGHRELAHDLQALGELLARELVALEEGDDLGEREALTFARDHDRARPLAEAGVGMATPAILGCV